MAKKSVDITHASGITAEVVLNLGGLYTAKDLRSVQTKLTSVSGELRKIGHGSTRSGVLGRLGDHLTEDQRQLLLDAANLIDSVGNNVVHAKEKRQRSEKEAQRRREAREKRAKQLVTAEFPLPAVPNDHEDLLEIVKTALIYNRARVYQAFYSPTEFCLKQRPELGTPGVRFGTKRERDYSDLFHKITYLRSDLLDAIQDEISYDDGSEVEERLAAMKKRVADQVSQAALTNQEKEVIELWRKALDSLTPPASSSKSQEGQA
ncbi:hypothetical protein DK254_33055 [Pseudomonas sp. RW407]|uniref:hypothetical protein n=1 Tax=Pseudomonas sp. RW407 TaxID=2202894 RepID=UPI000D6ED1F3|nr:hypothetical protein [Pseudomonas sp. RW407]PWU27320.1 hypothetical protein DK254_33055 [Pseudomonas sp. RW407]